ncbi:MAG: hypothetical protein K2X66_15360 [Cyanobacteria bacterium]|nr:hypothetical protein [Cyanobacteriota bacterium]
MSSMSQDPFQISMSTLIEVSKILGCLLKDKTPFRNEQNEKMAKFLQAPHLCRSLAPGQEDLFAFGSIDFLVVETPEGTSQFFPIEFNGTGTTGLVNMSPYAIQQVMESFTQLAIRQPKELIPLILLPYYDKKASNPLIYEKIMIAEALKKGLINTFGEGKIFLLSELQENELMHSQTPTVVVGDLRQFVQETQWTDGHLSLMGRRITASLHDIFCQNLKDKYPQKNIVDAFQALNEIFPICADKSIAYQFMNEYLASHRPQGFVSSIGYQVAHTEEELIERIQKQVRNAEKIVIKPHGAGIGNGIQFFVNGESFTSIQRKVKRSIEQTEGFYGVSGGVFPYTLCDFVDAQVIRSSKHPYFNHKYEMRFIVYQSEGLLKAYPSALKMAGKPYDKNISDDLMLLMNATSISESGGQSMVLPLCNDAALEATGLTLFDFEAMCQFSTGFVQHVLNRYQANPECFLQDGKEKNTIPLYNHSA